MNTLQKSNKTGKISSGLFRSEQYTELATYKLNSTNEWFIGSKPYTVVGVFFVVGFLEADGSEYTQILDRNGMHWFCCHEIYFEMKFSKVVIP